jgi:hypothetical protein
MAQKWGDNPPPIVVVTGETFSVIGDGRGRVTYAAWKDIPLHTWELRLKENRDEIFEEGTELSLEVLRQDSIRGITAYLESAEKERRKEKGQRVRYTLASLFSEDVERSTVFYHGTNREFAPGDNLLPPEKTGSITEPGRKKNLDKVFLTQDKGYAKIYAGRAVQLLGGQPAVYQVEPTGDIETKSDRRGATVFMSPTARVIRRIE